MNRLARAALPALVLLLAGCSGSSEVPLDTPSASVTASVVNYAPSQNIVSGVENVWFQYGSVDGSWRGEDVLKQKTPSKTYNVPANTNVDLGFQAMQGGFAYDGGCGVKVSTNLPENGYFVLDFEMDRQGDTPRISGCHVSVYQIKSGKKVLLDRYDGAAATRNWVLKVGGLTMDPSN